MSTPADARGPRRRARGDGSAGGAPVPPWYRLAPAPTGATGGAAGDPARIAVIGAGLAGCHLVHELARSGLRATLVDAASGPARGASGNPVGIVKPFVTREPCAAERFHAEAFAHLETLLADPALAAAARHRRIGALQLVDDPWPGRDDLERLDAVRACERAAAALDAPGGALAFADAGSLDPRALCAALLDRASRDGASPDARFGRRLRGLHRADGAWRVELDGPDGTEWLDADAVVLANGPGLVDTPWTGWLPMTPARGQMTRFTPTNAGMTGSPGAVPSTVIAGRSWAVPDGDGVWAGATYARDDLDGGLRESDDAANRAALQALLPVLSLRARASAASAGVRATTPDRLPFAGPVPYVDAASARYADLARGRPPDAYARPDYVDGLAVLGGFGSRGIVTSGWTAHLVARWLAGDGAPLEAATPLVGPLRFVVRPLVRGRTPRLRGGPAEAEGATATAATAVATAAPTGRGA